MSEKYQGELHVLCLGSTTNLAGAGELHPQFYNNIKDFSFMGGLTEPLFVGGKPMSELNFSIDWPSSLEVLSRAHDIRIATARNCLSSYFDEDDFLRRTAENDHPAASFLKDEIQYWFDHNRTHWNQSGFVNWDLLAAVQLIHPEFFKMTESVITPDEESMKSGYLNGKGPVIKVILPEITDQKKYIDHIYETFFKFNLKEKK